MFRISLVLILTALIISISVISGFTADRKVNLAGSGL